MAIIAKGANWVIVVGTNWLMWLYMIEGAMWLSW